MNQIRKLLETIDRVETHDQLVSFVKSLMDSYPHSRELKAALQKYAAKNGLEFSEEATPVHTWVHVQGGNAFSVHLTSENPESGDIEYHDVDWQDSNGEVNPHSVIIKYEHRDSGDRILNRKSSKVTQY